MFKNWVNYISLFLMHLGFRNGNPYFPFYSVPLHEYPGYLVPQHPVHTRVNRRPYFNGPPSSPMFYQATRFRHYSPGKRTETKETQTDPRQPESKQKKYQDHNIEMKCCDAGNMASLSSSVGKGTDSSLERGCKEVSSTVPDIDFTKSSSGSVQFRSLPPSGYAFEKEEVRIEYGTGGSPAIQLWKSFKETIPLYDVVKKPVPENVMQRDVFARSACEVLYGQGELVPSISYSEEQKSLGDVKARDPPYEAKVESEEQGAANQRAKSPVDEAKAVQMAEPIRSDQLETRQDALALKRSGSKRASGTKAPQGVSNLARQSELFPSGMELTNDLGFPQKCNEDGLVMNDSKSTLEKTIWCDESEKYIPSESWLACLDNLDTNYNYNMYLSRRKRPSILSLTSDEMSSVDEASSVDNAPLPFAPGFMLPKGMYAFKSSTEGLGREKIKSGGSLNEDGEAVGSEQADIGDSQNSKYSGLKIKEIGNQNRKLGILPRSSSKKMLYSLKKKATKSLSPSEAEDSEEYWVKEPEEDEESDEEDYLVQEVAPYGPLTPSKSGLYQQIGKRVLWRIPKNAVPAQLISWPAEEKVKISKLAPKLKEQDSLDGDYCLRRPTAQHEVPEHRRKNAHKYSGKK